MLVIADSGVSSSTAAVVSDVSRIFQRQPQSTSGIFAEIGNISRQARQLIQEGKVEELGPLMDQNQRFLQELSISSPELDRLVEAARIGGAAGAKLSGGGRGGNIIALVSSETAANVERALTSSGAVQTWITTIPGGKG